MRLKLESVNFVQVAGSVLHLMQQHVQLVQPIAILVPQVVVKSVLLGITGKAIPMLVLHVAAIVTLALTILAFVTPVLLAIFVNQTL